jgi:hypothetical protein
LIEELKREALTALRLGKPPEISHHLKDGRLLYIKAYDEWTFDFILAGDRVSELTASEAIGQGR